MNYRVRETFYLPRGELSRDGFQSIQLEAEGDTAIEAEAKLEFNRLAYISALQREWVWDYALGRTVPAQP